jgi:hypothetical protein
VLIGPVVAVLLRRPDGRHALRKEVALLRSASRRREALTWAPYLSAEYINARCNTYAELESGRHIETSQALGLHRRRRAVEDILCELDDREGAVRADLSCVVPRRLLIQLGYAPSCHLHGEHSDYLTRRISPVADTADLPALHHVFADLAEALEQTVVVSAERVQRAVSQSLPGEPATDWLPYAARHTVVRDALLDYLEGIREARETLAVAPRRLVYLSEPVDNALHRQYVA